MLEKGHADEHDACDSPTGLDEEEEGVHHEGGGHAVLHLLEPAASVNLQFMCYLIRRRGPHLHVALHGFLGPVGGGPAEEQVEQGWDQDEDQSDDDERPGRFISEKVR